MPTYIFTIGTTAQKVLSYNKDRKVILVRSTVDWEFSHSQYDQFFSVPASIVLSFNKTDGDNTELELWVRSAGGTGTLYIYTDR